MRPRRAEARSPDVVDALAHRTQAQEHSVLRRIVTDFGGKMALDCDVVRGGVLASGDAVELL